MPLEQSFTREIELTSALLAEPSLLIEMLVAAKYDGVRAIALTWRGGPNQPLFPAGEAVFLERFELPLVFVATGGRVEGAAFTVAIACDIRIAAGEVEFGAPGGPSERLKLMVGESMTATLLAQGTLLGSDAALAAGLIGFRGTPEEVAAEGRRMTDVIASRGPFATRLGKEAIWHGLAMPLEQGLRFETDLTLLLQTTKDRAEGVAAFLEKRPPIFTGE